MNIEIVWNNIKHHQGDIFYTITGKPYRYKVHNDYLTIEDIKGSNIKKGYIEKAIRIDNPTPKKIELEGCWGPSYIYGIITDKRIKI